MTDEHATHLGYADSASNVRREAVRKTEAREQLQHHVEELGQTVRRLAIARDEIETLEKSGVKTVVCTASTGEGLRSGMNVEVAVPKDDVLEQMRIQRDGVQRNATRHLEAIAAFIEGK